MGAASQAAATQSAALWYASRAFGVVSLALLSVVMILGILVNRQERLPGLPAFAVTGLHRSVSLLALAFIVVHVITVVVDPFVSVSAAAVVIPFVSAYQPFWLGLGAITFDLVAALIITSLLRYWMPRRAWRGIHWLAYAAWPVALVHGIGASPDLRWGGLLVVTIICCAAVGAALVWRIAQAFAEVPRAERAAGALARSEREERREPGGSPDHGGTRHRGRARGHGWEDE
jgi:sulfoxide reductase heme-binding subunit YedZ